MTAGTSASGVWSLIGPQPQDTLGITSGRVTALAVDPRDRNVVYAGGAEGGIWKSIDGGSTWIPLTDSQASLSTGTIALDPSHPDVIYVGTGEANDNGDSYGGAGILKSSNGGASWTSYPGPFVGQSIAQIAVSPTNSNVVLAGGSTRLYRSADGGATWTAVLAGSQVSAVLFATEGKTALAAVGNVYGGAGSGIYKSTDAGVTWTKLTGAASNGLPVTDLGRTILAADPSSPSTFYAGIVSVAHIDRMLGLYRTIDAGATWTQLSGGYCETQCWYNNVLAVSPRNPSWLYGGGSVLHISIDGGATWQSVAQSSDSTTLGGNCCLHPDQHALAFSADGARLYVGNDGGVYRTGSVGATAPQWTTLNSALALTQFYRGIAVHPTNPAVVYGGTQDNGTLRYSGSLTWSYLECGDGGATAIDPLRPATVYLFCNGGSLWRSQEDGMPSTFQLMGRIGETAPFAPYLTIDPSNPSNLYLGGSTHVWRSNNAAATWLAVSPDIAGGNDVCSVAVSPVDSNTVYAGTCDGAFWMTANAAQGTASTWVDRSAKLPAGGRAILRILPDAVNALGAYVTLADFGKGHVFRTADGGVTWMNASGNLPNIPVSDLIQDPDLAGTLYAATDVGVFWTNDSGTTWSPLMNGLPQAAVTGLGFVHGTRTLRAATHGRSVWEMALPLPLLNLTPSVTAVSEVSAMLAVAGANFVAGSVVRWNGQDRATTYVSATQLRAALTAADAAAGSYAVTVYNPPPGGGVSLAMTLTIAPKVSTAPAVQSGGVISASQFGAFGAIAPGSWIEIYGVNLAATHRVWSSSDFVAGVAPTSLDGVTVTIGGQPAFVEFVDPGQINALAPSNLGSGPQQLIVSAPGGVSAPYTVQVNATQPGLLAPAGSVRPGDILTLYGVGFGPVTPSMAAGVLVDRLNALALQLEIRIGGQVAETLYAGLAPGLTGLYQFNVVTPAIADNDAAALTFTLGGKPGTQALSVSVRR